MGKIVSVTTLSLAPLGLIGTSSAVGVTWFGPKQYLRTGGELAVYNDSCSATPGEGSPIVKNGEQDASPRIDYAVSSAYLRLNGVGIFGPKDFNERVGSSDTFGSNPKV